MRYIASVLLLWLIIFGVNINIFDATHIQKHAPCPPPLSPVGPYKWWEWAKSSKSWFNCMSDMRQDLLKDANLRADCCLYNHT